MQIYLPNPCTDPGLRESPFPGLRESPIPGYMPPSQIPTGSSELPPGRLEGGSQPPCSPPFQPLALGPPCLTLCGNGASSASGGLQGTPAVSKASLLLMSLLAWLHTPCCRLPGSLTTRGGLRWREDTGKSSVICPGCPKPGVTGSSHICGGGFPE
jgi:hypothetical protein